MAHLFEEQKHSHILIRNKKTWIEERLRLKLISAVRRCRSWRSKPTSVSSMWWFISDVEIKSIQLVWFVLCLELEGCNELMIMICNLLKKNREGEPVCKIAFIETANIAYPDKVISIILYKAQINTFWQSGEWF